jgi:SAM-dependent methyltransferase
MTEEPRPRVDLYGAHYGGFASDLYADVRRRAFGEDIGQNSWVTADELDLFIERLAPGRGSRLLDIACGSGGVTLRIARIAQAEVHGVDMHEAAVREARAGAERDGLSGRATFHQLDGSRPLPFPEGSFDSLICVDAINHLPDRPAILSEWARVLTPGGRLVFTDPVVLTGPITNEEIAIRSSIGFFLFVPMGVNERLLASAGFEVIGVDDRTENMARIAERWHAARESRSEDLRRVEGEEGFAGQQRFLAMTGRLAAERRLSRLAYHATRS